MMRQSQMIRFPRAFTSMVGVLVTCMWKTLNQYPK